MGGSGRPTRPCCSCGVRRASCRASARWRPSAEGVGDDGCRVSCVDWYGNARPIFLGDRIFALMGYEIVEGRLEGDGVQEVRRADFAPSVPVAE